MDAGGDSLAKSREHEMRTYLSSMRAMYDNAVAQNGEIYDRCFRATAGFSDISADAIRSDSRIIRILRYVVSPSISQMKFGQLFGLSTIETVERDRVATPKGGEQLRVLAPKIAAFVAEHRDRNRFLWLNTTLENSVRQVAETYAKAWTCSLIADQNAQTEYRNWRKSQQELAIEAKLVEMGYVRSMFAGDVERRTDINLGEYSKERRVCGGTVQKADLVVRRRGDGKLFLIEAKAVGVQVDAFKRVKECCDKARDWQSNRLLDLPAVVVVLGGFFVGKNLDALAKVNVAVAWEHDLDTLRAVLETP